MNGTLTHFFSATPQAGSLGLKGPRRGTGQSDFESNNLNAPRGEFEFLGLLLLRCLMTGIAYYLTTRIVFALFLPNTRTPIAFPSYAVLTATLLFASVRYWWAYALAAICGHHLAAWQFDLPLADCLHCEVFGAVKCILAAAGIRLFVHAPLGLATLREAFAVILIAAIVVPFATSFWAAAYTTSNGNQANYWIEWWNLGLANAATAIALLPGLIIAGASSWRWPKGMSRKRLLEAIVLATALMTTGILVFTNRRDSVDASLGLMSVPVPLLIWAALRFGPGGTSAALMLNWILAIWGTIHGRGPFGGHSLVGNVHSLHCFFLIISIPVTLLAVVIKETANTQFELRENEAQFRAMTDTAPVMIWKSDAFKAYTFFNHSWLNFTGRTLEQEAGNGWAQGVHPEDYARFWGLYTDSCDRRKDFTVEYRLRRHDGEYRWILASGVPRFDPYGAFQGYIGSCVDITNGKRADLEIQQHRTELAQLSRVTMMGEFSGSMAHALNQPLTAILCNAQAALRFLAVDSNNLEEVREILKDIAEEDKRAGEVIKRLRALFKKGEIRLHRLELNGLIDEVLKLLHSDLVKHNVVVERKLAEKLPEISGDRIQLQQVMINLILNGCDAMMNTQWSERRLWLRTELTSEQSVKVTVSDRGCGISPNRMDTIFEPFETTKSKSMGLGLAVCKTIIAAHGGRLWAENNPDTGASFAFALPTHKEIE